MVSCSSMERRLPNESSTLSERSLLPHMLPSGLPEIVADDEPIARFLTSSSQFSGTKRMVKPGAYMPDQNGRKSVFRHGAESLDALQSLSATSLSSTAHGVAMCRAKDIRAAQLDLEASEPPLRHADIVRWPLNDDPAM